MVNISAELAAQKCVPCKGGTLPMTTGEAKDYLRKVPGWSLGKTDKGMSTIFTDLKFKDFKTALAFVNTVGRIASREGHHPNMELYSWNRVRLALYTHAISGLSKNDFIMAAKISGKLPAEARRRK